MKTVVTALAAIAVNVASAAPTLLVNGTGQLTGANGVVVSGRSYDVRFADGPCSVVFDRCTAPSFAFSSFEDAYAAALAIGETVTINSPAGQFDTNPRLVFGCESSGTACTAIVPYKISGPFVVTSSVSNFRNFIDAGSDIQPFQFSFRPLEFDSTSDGSKTLAVFTLSVTEPATALLLAPGLLVLSALARRHSAPR